MAAANRALFPRRQRAEERAASLEAEHEEKREGYRHVESVGGSFQRTIPMPCEIDADAVKATYKQGVVTVVLPKLPEPRRHARSVRIETSCASSR